MKEKIKHCLMKSGLEALPTSSAASLADFGLDSLLIVLLVLQLESEFTINIPADLILAENFSTIDSITNLVQKQMDLQKGGSK